MSDTAKMEIKPRTLRALACDIEDCHNPQSWADYCRAAAAMLETQAARIAELEAALATARRDALAEIKQDTDELIEQGRQDGMEQAAQIADSCAADWAKSAIGKYINSKWDFQSRAEAGEEIAAAIRAAAKEVKP